MAKLSTDDAARRLPFVWYGDPAMPLPFHARWSAWGFALVASVIVSVLLAFLVPTWVFGFIPIVPQLTKVAFVAVASLFTGVLLTRKVYAHITTEKPLDYYRAVVMSELDTPREEQSTTHSLSPDLTGLWLETDPAQTVTYFIHGEPPK